MVNEHHAVLDTDLLWCPGVLWYPAMVAGTWKPYNVFTSGLPVIPLLGNLLQNSIVLGSLRRKLHEGALGSVGNGGRTYTWRHQTGLEVPWSFWDAATRGCLKEPTGSSHSSGVGRSNFKMAAHVACGVTFSFGL